MASNRLMDPIGKLMGLRYKSHPWHGVDIGKEAPEVIICFVEMVPTDTVKYEVDKETGYLKIDRPQKYSNVVPALYGFIPQTFSGSSVAVLNNDAVYQGYKDIADCPVMIIDRLKHYFLTYKDLPGNPRDVEITDVFGKSEAHEIINRSMDDYHKKFENLGNLLSNV